MLEPIASPRPSIIALTALLLILGGCQREQSSSAAPAPEATPTPIVTVAPAPALDRAALLQAMDLAASAHTAGHEVSGPSLAGRRFVVRQAFGCGGATPSPAQANTSEGLPTLTWGEGRKSLKLSLSPGDWAQSAVIAGDAETWEAAEGFWLARPWQRTEDCPAGQKETLVQDEASPQTMGLAAVFSERGSRTGRRNGRAYEVTLRGEGDQPPIVPAQGYRLVLEGRMAAFADGHAIRCRAASSDQRPVCIGAIHLDRVAFEDADGKMLSEWRGG